MSEPEPPREEEEEDEETGAYELTPEEERPVTLAPLEEIPSLAPLPEDMTTQEAFAPDEVEVGADDDVVSAPPLPTLHPLNLDGIFLWPIQGGRFLSMTGVFVLILLGLACAYWAGWFPILGPAMKLVIWIVVWILVLPYVLRATLASIAGAHLPPPWPTYGGDEPTYTEGTRMLLLLTLYQLPGIAAWIAFGVVPALVLLLAAWFLYPAAVLLLAATGRLGFTHPLESAPIAFLGGKRYLICLLPGIFVLLLRVALQSTILEPASEALNFPALVYTGFMVGRLPHEVGRISDRLLAISDRVEEEERLEAERWQQDLDHRESKGGAETAPPSDEAEN